MPFKTQKNTELQNATENDMFMGFPFAHPYVQQTHIFLSRARGTGMFWYGTVFTSVYKMFSLMLTHHVPIRITVQPRCILNSCCSARTINENSCYALSFRWKWQQKKRAYLISFCAHNSKTVFHFNGLLWPTFYTPKSSRARIDNWNWNAF